jgi:cellulose synthase/poly-beta-1,6-N-acetylglucosamine synthase-like glycosyltransferase
MTAFCLALFWFGVFWVVFVYALYPAFLLLAGRLRRRQPAALLPDSALPSVTMLIPAYNEERVIAHKIESTLAMQYPPGKLEIVVVSDRSSDRTDEIAQRYAERGVRFFRNEEQKGKIRTVSDLGVAATTDVLLITDANAIFEPDALRHLVSNFADARVGIVNGNRILKRSESMAGEGEGAYWTYETLLRQAESDLFSNAFVVGAMTAIRRELFIPLPGYLEFDHVLPLHVVNRGYRVVFEQRAVFHEETAPSARAEWRVRVRNAVRGFTMVLSMREYLDLGRHIGFACHVWCRKVLRWLIGVPAVVAFGANAGLLHQPLYALLWGGQVLFYTAALFGWALERRGIRHRLLALPFYFCLVNAASAAGLWQAVRGRRMAVWQTGR